MFLKISRKIRKPANVWSANVSHTTVIEGFLFQKYFIVMFVHVMVHEADHVVAWILERRF